MLTPVQARRPVAIGSQGGNFSPPRRTPGIRRVFGAPRVQTKLKVGAVNDPAEAEADRVADHVMRMPEATSKADSPSITPTSGASLIQRTDWGVLGGKACLASDHGQEWALVGEPATWRALSDGDCTGSFEDCDGMTCGGGFYKIPNLIKGTCRTPREDAPFFASRRWTPNSRAPDAESPSEIAGRGFDETPPGYQYDE